MDLLFLIVCTKKPKQPVPGIQIGELSSKAELFTEQDLNAAIYKASHLGAKESVNEGCNRSASQLQGPFEHLVTPGL